MKKIVLLLVLTTLLFKSQAQFDKEKFEQIFEEETSDDKYSKRENHSSRYLHYGKEVLPQWLFEPPISNDSTIIAIGISDPGLDSTHAINMAILRAQIMANILRKSTTQLLCDFFMNDQTHSQQVVYEHYSRIISRLPDTADIQVLNIYKNRFDETMVLISYTTPKFTQASNLKTIFLELYKNEIENSIYGNYESVYELMLKESDTSKPIPLSYQLTEYGPRADVIAITDSIEYQVPIYSLSYKNTVATDTASTFVCTHGIWKEYIKATINSILEIARQKPENIQVMGDKYQTDSYEKLTRGLSINKMRFVFQGIEIKNDQLYVNMQELALE